MRKVVIKGVGQADIIDTSTPKPKEDWALVKIHVAPLCTEYKAYRDGEHNAFLGHEAAGEVVEVARPGQVEVGDRVVVMPQYPCGQCSLCLDGEYIHCQDVVDVEAFTGSREGTATYAQYMLKPSWLLPRIPDGMSYEHASMLCCGLGPTFGAMERMAVNESDTVLITGMGPVGLGGVVNGVYRQARVIAVSHHDYRSDLARELGAEVVINPDEGNALQKIRDLTNGQGVDKSIECAGDPSAQRLCLEATRRNGQISFVGESGELAVRVSDDLIRNGLALHGVWHYNLNDIPKLFQMVEDSGQVLDKLITHAFPMDQVVEAWELQLTRRCGKVILYPWQ
jgi:threonine dehydrogenase-like Zn-dependent dehydrogenase